jgi:hypothetical protein
MVQAMSWEFRRLSRRGGLWFEVQNGPPAPRKFQSEKPAVTKTKRQIIVFASKGEKRITYRMNRQTYTGKELDYLLGELHDRLTLSDTKFVPAMALKAGFSDVRVFVYWEKTAGWRRCCSAR